MIAHGLSNTEIAVHRIVSQATVKTHVNRILSKPASATASKPSCSPTNADSFDPEKPRPPNTLTGLSTGHAPAGRHGSAWYR